MRSSNFKVFGTVNFLGVKKSIQNLNELWGFKKKYPKSLTFMHFRFKSSRFREFFVVFNRIIDQKNRESEGSVRNLMGISFYCEFGTSGCVKKSKVPHLIHVILDMLAIR